MMQWCVDFWFWVIGWGGMFWMIDFERLGMVVNVLELMGIDWVLRLFGTPSDSYLIQLVTWEDEQFQVVFFLSAEDWGILSQAMNDWVISQPLPTCPDVLLVPWQLIHFWHYLESYRPVGTFTSIAMEDFRPGDVVHASIWWARWCILFFP